MHCARMLQAARKPRLLAAALLPALFACGCESMSHTDKGVLGGGAVGGLAGAAIGSATGHTGAGAAIGAALGGITGGLLGSNMDDMEKRHQDEVAALQPSRGPLSIPDVIGLAHQHISDDLIITQIRTTGSVYHLNPTDLRTLKENGVSDRVVQEMQQTAYRPTPPPRRVYVETPVYEPVYRPVYYVREPPPPVGVGISYTHVGRIR